MKRKGIIIIAVILFAGSLSLLLIPLSQVFSVNSWTYGDSTFGVSPAVITEDGKYIVGYQTSYEGSEYFLSAVSDPEPIWTKASGGPKELVVSENGTYFAALSGNIVTMFDKNSPNPLWSRDLVGTSTTIAISADGNYLAAGSCTNTLNLFNSSSSTPLWTSSGGSGCIESVDISGDGYYIVGLDWLDKVVVYNKTSSTFMWSFSMPYTDGIVKISKDGRYVVAGDTTLYVFTVNGSLVWANSVEGTISQIVISNDGSKILVRADLLYLFDITSSIPIWTTSATGSVAMSADGKYIAMCEGSQLHLLNSSSPTPIWTFIATQDLVATSISGDGRYIAATSIRVLYLFNRDTCELMNTIFIPWVTWEFIIIGICTVSGGSAITYVSRSRKKKREKTTDIAHMKEIKKLIKGADKIKIETIREKLNIEKQIFYPKIIKWASQFDFTLDGEYLILNKDTVSDFIDALDKKFEKWESMEREGVAKKL